MAERPTGGAPRTPRGTRAGSVRVTERDRELLAFVADHRLVLAPHVQALLGISAAAADARLRALASVRMIKREPHFHRQPACCQITLRGLAVIGSDLPPPRLDLRSYRHDVGVAWLWLAAHAGTFGEHQAILSERQLRSHDAKPDGRPEPLAVRLGGYGPSGAARLHYPDLLLQAEDGRRVALELELSQKGRTRREKILAGYAADARINAVVYLVEERAVGRSIGASAARLGISSLVHVQLVRMNDPAPAADQSAPAQRLRTAGRGAQAER